MNCPLLKKRRGTLEVEDLKAVPRSGNGADDEVTRRAVKSHGEEDQLVGGGGDHRGDGPDDEAVARAAGDRWLFGLGGPAQGEAERQAGAGGQGGRSAAAVSPGVLRSEHAALSREAQREAWDRVELHVRAEGAARGRTGGARAQAAQASPAAGAAAHARHAAAH